MPGKLAIIFLCLTLPIYSKLLETAGPFWLAIAETSETELFVRNFDRLFNCLNVRSLTEWKAKHKIDLKPYTFADDERLKVCQK